MLNNTNTHCRTPLEKGLAHHKGLYMTKSNTDKRPVPPVGFKPAIPASQWLQIYTHTQSPCHNFNSIHCCILDVQSEQSKRVSEASDGQSCQISKKNLEQTVCELYVPYSFEKYVDKLLSIWKKINHMKHTDRNV
jgi:hypothetical protein